MKDFFTGKTILITGGTGSLGRAIIRNISKYNVRIVVYSRDEGKQALYFGGSKIDRVIGDIRDLEKLKTTIALYKPNYVIHTAALKRVDDMEFYPEECVKTNIQGTENVAVASLLGGVEKCILVSTDKACNPVNVYGSSKLIAERIFTNYDYKSYSTIFASVRYGNVIASRGSFIPLWKSLIEKGEKIKVTSPECSRFLFTLNDAVDTVLSSLYNAEGGEVFIPKINSFNMDTIIKAMKSVTNRQEIDFEVIGMRPGEKIHEDMLGSTELPYTKKVDEKLLVVLPQYTNKSHTYKENYQGEVMNSSLHLSDDHQLLSGLIKRGVEEA
jgi:FlaA1/EpsC-like NDP-sugar epimerase